MCLLINSAFEGLSAVCDIQALALLVLQLNRFQERRLKISCQMKSFACFLKQLINIILF